MIRLIDGFEGSCLRESHLSRVIKSHFLAYGAEYDFCRFYEMAERRRKGIIAVFNGAVSAELCEGEKPGGDIKRELGEFISFQRPAFAEIPEELIGRRGLKGYISKPRVFFEIPPAESSDGLITPEPEAAFAAIGSGGDYGLWLTDTLRRTNMGLARLYGYESSVLTLRFAVSGKAYISDVATPPDDRGKGYARELLGRVSRALADEGLCAYLSALPETAEYYRSLGYPEIGGDKVYVLNDDSEII